MGASVSRQCLAAGLLDEMALTLVPVFLGGGIRLFENLGGADIDFAPQRPVETPGVTHLRFRVIR
jgi:dihydrofolate reductase